MDKPKLSFSDGKEGSLRNILSSRIGFHIFIRTVGREVQYVERQYGDVTVFLSAMSVYLMYGPNFISLWPLLLTTFTLAHSLVHVLFSATASILSSVALKTRNTARKSEYILIQKFIIPSAPFTVISESRDRLLLRHQDRGGSDYASHDNLLRRSSMAFLNSCIAASGAVE